MKLYGTLTSPYVRKVRVLLLEKDIPCEFIIEAPADAAGNVARLNPLGRVPVLQRNDGEVLFDSPMIVEYLDSLSGEPLMPVTGEPRWMAQRWHALAQGIMDAVVARLLESRRPDGLRDDGNIAKQEETIAAALRFAEAHLPDTPFLMGERLTIADIAMAVALDYIDLRYPHDWTARHPGLVARQQQLGMRPAFVATRAPV